MYYEICFIRKHGSVVYVGMVVVVYRNTIKKQH